MKSKLILIAGIKRSGSTWMYNAVRIILKQAGEEFYGSNRKNYDATRHEEYHILKVHRFFPEYYYGAWRVFTSIRSIPALKSSYERFTEKPLTDDRLTEMVLDLLNYQAKSSYLMLYERMIEQPTRVIEDLAGALELSVSSEAVLNELSLIKPPQNVQFDNDTLLFQNHIGFD